jgi:hypothetical protein
MQCANNYIWVAFQVLTAESMMVIAFCDIVACSLVEVDPLFQRDYIYVFIIIIIWLYSPIRPPPLMGFRNNNLFTGLDC